MYYKNGISSVKKNNSEMENLNKLLSRIKKNTNNKYYKLWNKWNGVNMLYEIYYLI